MTVFDQIEREMLFGMRAQASGRDATLVVNHLRANPDLDIDPTVPPELAHVDWCRVNGQVMTGVTYEQAQVLGATVWTGAGQCLEVVVPVQQAVYEPTPRSRVMSSRLGGLHHRSMGDFGDPDDY